MVQYGAVANVHTIFWTEMDRFRKKGKHSKFNVVIAATIRKYRWVSHIIMEQIFFRLQQTWRQLHSDHDAFLLPIYPSLLLLRVIEEMHNFLHKRSGIPSTVLILP